jgi:phage gpG-like protein
MRSDGEGHKLLIGRSRLINSIRYQTTESRVTIGTNVSYAAVHQYGYSGPQSVKSYSYTLRVKSRDVSAKVRVLDKGTGRYDIMRKRKTVSGVTFVTVKAFTRNIRIPARPFLVFRPEDPARIGEQVRLWELDQARAAGLEVK